MSFVEKNVKKYRVLFIVVGLLTCCLSGCSVNQPHKKSNKPASVSLNCSKRDARLAADYLHDIASNAVFDQSLTATFVKLGKTDTLKERACIANYIRTRIQPLDPITFNLHLQEMGCYFVDLHPCYVVFLSYLKNFANLFYLCLKCYRSIKLIY